MHWFQIALQVVPVTMMASGLTWVALACVPSMLAQHWSFPLILVGILLFAAMLSFKEARGWNVVLLLAFASVVGLLLGSSGWEGRNSDIVFAIATASLLLSAAAVVGNSIGSRSVWTGPVLWVLSWGYLLGWAGIAILQLAVEVRLPWSVVGLLLFSGLATVWFAGLMDGPPPPSSVALAIDLYILAMNLALAGTVLAAHLLPGPTAR